MPRVIDNRVVEMEFDNSNFERNVSTSLSTLDKLKAALSFKGTDKDFSIVETSVTELGKSFSWIEHVGIGAFRKLGESIEGWAEKTVKTMSGVGNVIQGFTKFGDITKATGTLKGQGYELSEIETQLSRLNWFSDETSYSLADMVQNISKFTASGQKLDESSDAMMGIALWAATAGQNAGTASRAMYQLSQALSAGYMRKEDWKSIQNASMDTRIFRQHALDAAVALKTLKKNSDGTYTSLVAEGKAGKEAFTIDQFTERLTEGAWFTKDVMMSVYREYAGGVDEIYRYTEEHGVTAAEAVEALKGKVSDFALEAFLAGQQARTWEDVVESVKDAASSGWMSVYQNLFGDYEGVVKFFTNLANRFYDIFVEPINGLNDVLEKWGEKGGQSAFIQSIYNIVSAIENFSWVFKHVFNKIVFGTTKEGDVFGIKVDRLLKITDAVKNFTEQVSNTIRHSLVFRRYLRAFLTIFDMAWQVISGFYRAVKDTFGGVGNVLKSIIEKLSYVVREFYYLGKRTKKNDTFFKFFSTALKPIKNLKERISNLYSEVLPELTRRWDEFKEKAKEKLEGPFDKLRESLKKLGETLKNAWSGLFGGGTAEIDAQKFWSAWEKVKQTFYDITGMEPGTFIDHVANGIDKLTEKVQKLNSWLTEKDAETGLSGIEKIQNAYESAVKWIKDNLGPIWTDVTGALGSVFQWIKDNWNGIWDTIKKVGSAIWSFLSGLWESISSIFSKDDGSDGAGFTGLLDSLKTIGQLLGSVLGSILSSITPIVENVKGTLGDLSLDNAGGFLKGGGIALLGAGFYQWAKNFKKSNWILGFGDILEGLAGPLDSFSHLLDGKALKEAAIGIGILVGSLLLLMSMPQDDMLGAALTLSMVLDVLTRSLKKLSGFSTTAKINKEGFNFTKTGAGSTILMLAVSMVAIAFALKMVAKIPEKDLYRVAFVVGILMAIVGSVIKNVIRIQNASNKQKLKNTGTLIGLAAFIGVVVIALKKISDMISENPKGFYIALAAVAGIMLALGIFLNSVSKTYKMTEMGRSVAATANKGFWKDILALGAAIYLVALAFERIATVKAGPLRMAGAAALIIAIMGVMVLFVKSADKTSGSKIAGVAGVAGGLLLFAAAIGIVATVFAVLAKVMDTVKNPDNVYLAFGLIAGAFLLFTGLFSGSAGSSIDPKKMAKSAAALMLLSVAIGLAAGSMLLLAQIPSDKVNQVIMMFGAVTLGIGILGMLASGPIGDGLVKIGEAVILIAGAAALLGLGFLAAAEAIKIFSDSELDVTRASDNISKVIDDMLDKLPEWTQKIVQTLLEVVLASIPATINAFVNTISDTLSGLMEKDPITGKMKIETLIENGLSVLLAIVDGISARSDEIVTKVGDMLVNLLRDLGDWVQNNRKDISDALFNLVDGLIGVILDLLSPLGEKIFGQAWDGENGIKTKIENNAIAYLEGAFLIWLGAWAVKAIGIVGGIGSKIIEVIHQAKSLTSVLSDSGSGSVVSSGAGGLLAKVGGKAAGLLGTTAGGVGAVIAGSVVANFALDEKAAKKRQEGLEDAIGQALIDFYTSGDNYSKLLAFLRQEKKQEVISPDEVADYLRSVVETGVGYDPKTGDITLVDGLIQTASIEVPSDSMKVLADTIKQVASGQEVTSNGPHYEINVYNAPGRTAKEQYRNARAALASFRSVRELD